MNQQEALKNFKLLRQDAIERNMIDLAIVYGWHAIAIGTDILSQKMAELNLRMVR